MGALIPFPNRAARQVGAAIINIRDHTLRETHRKLAECWEIRAESRAVRRRYLERQAKIEVLLQGIDANVTGVVKGEG